MFMCTAGVAVCALSGKILKTLNAALGIEYELSRAAIEIFAAELQQIGIFVEVYWQLAAVYLPGQLILHLYGHRVGNYLKHFIFRLFVIINITHLY